MKGFVIMDLKHQYNKSMKESSHTNFSIKKKREENILKNRRMEMGGNGTSKRRWKVKNACVRYYK